MSGCLLVINPNAGRGNAKMLSHRIQNVLATHFDTIEVRYTEKAGDAEYFVEDAVALGMDTYFVVGGDGTVNEAINGLAKMDKPLRFGFLPMGTVNDLARALKIPVQPYRAIESMRHFKWQAMDIGKINDKYFMNVVALGPIPDAVNHTTPEAKSRFGFFAYLRDGVNAAMNRGAITYRLMIDGKYIPSLTTEVIIIALTNSVGSFEYMVKNARVDDGYLHFLALKEGRSFQSSQKFIRGFLTGDISQAKNVIYQKAKEMTIQLFDEKQNLVSNMDGDPGPELPVHLSVLPRHIEVMVPEPKIAIESDFCYNR